MITYHHEVILLLCVFMYVYIVKTNAIVNYVHYKYTFKLKTCLVSIATSLFIVYIAKGIDYLIYHIQISFK